MVDYSIAKKKQPNKIKNNLGLVVCIVRHNALTV